MTAPNATATPSKGLILLAHGSRDPLWRQPFEELAQRMRQQQPDLPVACAYMELCEPHLPDAVAAFAARGVQHICIAPLFLGMGAHAREDLPRAIADLQIAHPAMLFSTLPILGENAAILDAITLMLTEALRP